MPASQYTDTRGRIRHCRPRRKKPMDAPGEYVTFEDLHILAWLAAHAAWCMAGRIEKIAAEITPKRDWRGASRFFIESVRKTLHRLRDRGLVRIDKPVKRVVMELEAFRKYPKKVYKHDLWEITRTGYEHLKTEMSVRFFSPEVADASWTHLLKMVKLARFEVIPGIKALDPKGGYPVYRIDLLIRTTPIFDMPDILKRAKKADNPCAYMVRCCIGTMDERDILRVNAWVAKVPFFQTWPDLVEPFMQKVREKAKEYKLSKLNLAMRVAKYVAHYFRLQETHTITRSGLGAHVVRYADDDLMDAAFGNAAAAGLLGKQNTKVSA